MDVEKEAGARALSRLGYRVGVVHLPGEGAPVRWAIEDLREKPGSITFGVFILDSDRRDGGGSLLNASWPCRLTLEVARRTVDSVFPASGHQASFSEHSAG